MNTRPLGRTGLHVTELALGGLFVSEVGGAFEQGQAATLRAVELGINYIDTAPGYANSEAVLGRILTGIKQPLILSTKLGYKPEPFDAQNLDCLRRSFDNSLRALGRDQIDILMVHEPDRQGQFNWWTDLERFTGPVLEFLDTLKRDGLIRFTGVGGTTAYELVRVMETGHFDVVLTAFNYSLLWREAECEILPTAQKLGMGVVIGSPLQQGALARRFDAEIADPQRCRWLSAPRRAQYRALYAYLDDMGLPIVEAGLRFVLSNPVVSCVLTGARSAAEVESSAAAAAKGPLPEAVLKRLNEIAAMVPFHPYEEPFNMPFQSDAIRAIGPAWR